jgi:hypothetical protein
MAALREQLAYWDLKRLGDLLEGGHLDVYAVALGTSDGLSMQAGARRHVGETEPLCVASALDAQHRSF